MSSVESLVGVEDPATTTTRERKIHEAFVP